MILMKVYLDTSVPSAYFDDRAPERRQLTRRFWAERLPEFHVAISTAVLKEIRDTPNAEKRISMEQLVSGFEVLTFDEEADNLAKEYVNRGIVPEEYLSDANHVAIAVVNGLDYFASWNFRHLVKVSTRREVNLVNALKGYRPLEIVAPPEL